MGWTQSTAGPPATGIAGVRGVYGVGGGLGRHNMGGGGTAGHPRGETSFGLGSLLGFWGHRWVLVVVIVFLGSPLGSWILHLVSGIPMGSLGSPLASSGPHWALGVP